MPGCAFGPCDNSEQRGGAGCHLCDVVTPGRVTYRVPSRHGTVTVTMNGTHRRDTFTKKEVSLTRTQAKKGAAKRKK